MISSMNLLPHQIKFASGYPDKAFLAHEGGTGKTVCACVWLHDGRDDDALIVCPKRVVKKWQKALSDWGTKGTVLSKEQFKKTPARKWSAIVLDEADEFASPLFTKDRSKLSEQMYALIRAHDVPVMLLSATPIRSTSWNLHTLLTFYGKYIDWKKWREYFFVLESRPYVKWKAWFPIPEWRTEARKMLEKYADIVLLKDCVGFLPPAQDEVIALPPRPFAGSDELHPTGRFVEEHKWEQQAKPAEIIEIAKEFKKVLVVAYYVEQVESLAKELSKDRKTYMVHGGTKGQEEILLEANALDDDCFLIVQASLGAGFDADTFSAVIFASMSYSVRDFAQMKFRVRRIHNLHPVMYYYLLAGRCDRQVYETILLGHEFVPALWKE